MKDARLPESRWRAGIRDDHARAGHAADTREWRRARADERMEQVQEKLLDLIRSGTDINHAAEQLGTSQQAIHGYADRNPKFAVELDNAWLVGRPDARHGTPTGYRWDRCRCSDCRAAHHR